MATTAQVMPVDDDSCGKAWPDVEDLHTLVQDRPTFKWKGGLKSLAQQLGTDLEKGLPKSVDVKARIAHFGKNAFADKELNSYWYYLKEALKDKLIIMLIAMATTELVVKMAIGPAKKREEGWIDPAAIYTTVLIIINVQSVLDYRRERLFEQLSQKLNASNLRFIIRGGEKLEVPDEAIVVGDVVSFNSHMASVIPADCVLISGDSVKTEEGALTGEPEPIPKGIDEDEDRFMISGTTVNSGSGKMLVVAVGINSVSGRIRQQVYEDDESDESPLFQKLDKMAGQIGMVGMTVATICFIASCIKGFGFNDAEPIKILEYIIVGLGILAVAIPEGLPLALTISLAFSSNKMASEFNLVKTLDSCETMGSATTICTDKTGTLTANRMTVRGIWVGGKLVQPKDAHTLCGSEMKKDPVFKDQPTCIALICNLVCVCTMDESQVKPPPEDQPGAEHQFMGNPTECALLKLAGDLGHDYNEIRAKTDGRSESTAKLGKCNSLTSARKMMSWAVPKKEGGCIVYVKGASEIILGRVVSQIDATTSVKPITDNEKENITTNVIGPFANAAMRTIALAYREMDDVPGDEVDNTILNADGTPAFICETQLTLVGIVGIEDPLRPEVPPAIQRCYTAGIDVRMVTGDNINTAIAIAKGAGILRAEHFDSATGEIKKYRAISGEAFRKHCHLFDEKGNAFFQQDRFDEIWPYLRVMARSSPDDKLALAKGLMKSKIFEDQERLRALAEEGVHIFADGQVVAMTGDGTNDAPALKAATVGFAMGIAGTQIAKDAANIILLDDNFASIVTAAKWGRNVYDCIQKFLQFQLTVNCAILVISLIVIIGSGTDEKEHPLPVTQMLWLNLIMDSLAALALASEPPSEEQLKRPPVNRSSPIITLQMVWNMLGQALYQVIVVCYLFFNDTAYPDWEDDLREPDGTKTEGAYTYHYTIIFNSFVLMQLFNQYNSRFLNGEWNILVGVHKNFLFLGTSWTTFALQALMANFAGKFMRIHDFPGLTGKQWGFCILLGMGPLVWQLGINVCTRTISYFGKRWSLSMMQQYRGTYNRTNHSSQEDVRHGGGGATKRSSRILDQSQLPRQTS